MTTRPPTFTPRTPTSVPPTEPPRDWTYADMGLHLSDRACAAIIALRAAGRSTLGWSEGDLEAYHRSHVATAEAEAERVRDDRSALLGSLAHEHDRAEKAEAALARERTEHQRTTEYQQEETRNANLWKARADEAECQCAALRAELRAADERWLNSLTTDGHAYRRAVDEAEVVGEAMRRAEAECAALREENAELRERLSKAFEWDRHPDADHARADGRRMHWGVQPETTAPKTAAPVVSSTYGKEPLRGLSHALYKQLTTDAHALVAAGNSMDALVVQYTTTLGLSRHRVCPRGAAKDDPRYPWRDGRSTADNANPPAQPAAPADWRPGDLVIAGGWTRASVVEHIGACVRLRELDGSHGGFVQPDILRRPPLAVGQWVRWAKRSNGRIEALSPTVAHLCNGDGAYIGSRDIADLIPIADPDAAPSEGAAPTGGA